MKTIKLIALNSQYVHSSLSVITIERMYNFYRNEYNLALPDVLSLQLSVNDSFDSLIHSIVPDTDIYAFSVYIWNVSLVKKLCSYLKKSYPGCTVILGGPEVSYGCDIECDYVISGEGERSFFSLISFLYGFSVPQKFDFNLTGKTAACSPVQNLSEFLFPYTYENVDSFRNRILYYESSRGCPFSCAYCLSSVSENVRVLPLNRVFSDIDFFISHNVSQVKFVDRTFNFDKKRAYSVWKYIIDNASCSSINFHFEVGADLLDGNCIKLLETAPPGLIQLEAGIQSTNSLTLNAACRITDNNKAFSNISRLVSFSNINIHVDLIAGLPFESFDSFKRSFNDAYRLGSHQLQLGFLKLLKGAPLNYSVSEHGLVFSDYPPYEVIKNNYISQAEILTLKKVEDCLERFYNSGRFSLSLSKIISSFSSPFAMYHSLADKAESEGLLFKSVNSKKLYDFLSSFSCGYGIDADRELLLDFFLSEKTEIVPESLRYLTHHYKSDSPAVKGNKSAQYRLVGDKLYAIDYSARNRVTGRYGFSVIN